MGNACNFATDDEEMHFDNQDHFVVNGQSDRQKSQSMAGYVSLIVIKL